MNSISPSKSSPPKNLDRPEYARNDGSRCFHCKDELFTVMEKFREARGFDAIAYGVNLDDQGDFRPGQAAAKQHAVAAPLLDAGLTKADIRELAQPPACGFGTSPLRLVCHRASNMDARSRARRFRWSSRVKTLCALWASGNTGSGITEILSASKLRAKNCRGR